MHIRMIHRMGEAVDKLIYHGRATRLMDCLHLCLSFSNGECRSRAFINAGYASSPPGPGQILFKPGPNGEHYFTNDMISGASWWRVTEFGYQEYLKACKELGWTPHKKPAYLDSDQEIAHVDNKAEEPEPVVRDKKPSKADKWFSNIFGKSTVTAMPISHDDWM